MPASPIVTALDTSNQLDQMVTRLFDLSLGVSETENITSTSSDIDIIKSIIAGAGENYRFLVDRYYNPIYNYLFRSVNFHVPTSEDLTGETFYKAYLSLNRYNPGAKFSSWLYKIAHNILIDYYRSFRQTHTDIDTISDDAASREIAQKLTSDALEINISSNELLEPVLNALKEEDRQLLQLFYIEQLSVQEIAEIYNVFPGTIKTRLHRARSKAKNLVLMHTNNHEGTFSERVESFLSSISSVFNKSNKSENHTSQQH